MEASRGLILLPQCATVEMPSEELLVPMGHAKLPWLSPVQFLLRLPIASNLRISCPPIHVGNEPAHPSCVHESFL